MVSGAGGREQDHVVGQVGVADEVLSAVDYVVVAAALGPAGHAPQVGAGVGLAHGQALHPLAPHGGQQVLLHLVAGAGPQDVGRPGHDVVQGVGGPAEGPLGHGQGQVVEPAPAQLDGHVGRVDPGVDGFAADLLHELGRHLAGALHLGLVGYQLALGERPDGVDHHLLGVVDREVQTGPPCQSLVPIAMRRPASGGLGKEECAAVMAATAAAGPSSSGALRPAAGVHVDQHLLAGAQRLAGPVHGVEDVQPLPVAAQHLGGDPKPFALRRLPQVVQVGLDRVVRVTAGPVGLVDPDVAEEGIGGPAEGGQEGPLGHVAVVVHPVGLHHGRVQRQRGSDLGTRRPRFCLRGRSGGQDPGLPLGDYAARADAARSQRPHHRQQAVVPLPLELGDGPTAGLVVAARSHGLDQISGQLGCLQPGPRQLQRGPELAQHVAHPALAPGQVEGEVGAHRRPAQAGAVHDRVVQLGGGGSAVAHQVKVLAPQRLLEAVRQVALDLVAHQQRMHDQVVVVGHCGRDRLLGGCLAGNHLDQGQQVHRVERVADEKPLRVAQPVGQTAGQ